MLNFTTRDHPEANGRTPRVEEQSWTFTFDLEGGRSLVVNMGKECHDIFRGFILREELEDAADEASANIEEDTHASGQ